MRGTVEVPSDAILGEGEIELRGLPPEVLELVPLARLGGEDVEDRVEEVEHDPAGRALAVDPAGEHPVLVLQPQLHLVDDRLRLALVAACADRQEVGVGGERPHVEDDDLARPFRVGERGERPCQQLGVERVHE